MEARRRTWWEHPAERPEFPWRRDPRAWIRSQIALAAVVAALEVLGTHFAGHRQLSREPLDALAVALIVGGAAALPFRRRYPVGVLLFVHTTTLAYWLLDYPGGPVFLALVIAYFHVVLTGRRAIAWTVLVVGFAAFAVLPWLVGNDPAPTWAGVAGMTAWMLVLGTFAEIARNGRERAREVAQRAQEEQRRRASEERLRIARELHDVLAHNISMINVQAGVALHLIDERPEQARPALAAIKQASKEALTELRSVLGVLRQVDEDADGSRAPAPTLARLDDLVSRPEAAGLAVRRTVEGSVRPLPAAVDLAAFRIVQEALTNVVRHAGASAATVLVRYGSDELELRIDDDGRGGTPETAAGGSGIVGMRERAESVGGTLEAGPRPGGGFGVLARLPIGAAAMIRFPLPLEEPGT